MAWKLADLFVEITGRDAKLNATLDSIASKLSSWSIAKGVMAGNLLSGAINTALSGVQGGISFFGSTLEQASNLNETLARVRSTFGVYQAPILAFADEMSRKYAQSRNTILSGAEEMAMGLEQVGMSGSRAADYALKLSRIASTYSRTRNVPLAEAYDQVQRAVEGMTRSLKIQGMAFSEQEVEQQAFRMGARKIGDSFLEMDLKAARAEVIMRKFQVAMGSMGDGSGRYAGQTLQFWGRLDGLWTRIGQAVLPAYETGLRVINHLFAQQGGLLDWVVKQIGAVADRVKTWLSYLALVGTHTRNVWRLYRLEAEDAFRAAIKIGQNLFEDFASFLGDLFDQVGRDVGAKLWNGLQELWTGPHSNAISRQVAGMLGMTGQKMTAPGVSPNYGLIGDPLRDLPKANPEIEALRKSLDQALGRAGLAGIAGEKPGPLGVPTSASPVIPMVQPSHSGVADWAKVMQEKILGQNYAQQQLQAQQKIAANTEATATGIKTLTAGLAAGVPAVAS